ncbi:MAG: HAMP domain-containing histidine kinase [Proteobacteria bacterium]|nr:HAMP domain-containing histidine kinase [Pseudomonadota bacterium]MBU1585603.1 HAMP domain-containing histidine kinase [Pseudomonadota bacterium]MBU2453027.1 HAMP domain-containing histidine kinase [Pseudomonadota bacterium]MBU2629463.1 HAMP domain-containing histidine kinase [Pseudomonadota bacterium]
MPDTTIKTEILIHDLKVPISVIDAGAKSLLNRQDAYGPLTDKQIKVLNRIIRNTLTTQRLVNDVLELGRSREGVMITCDFSIASLVTCVLMEVFDLSDPGVADIIRKIQTYDELEKAVLAGGVRLSFDSRIWKSVVHLDEAKVRQILRNIVTNAFKHRSSFVQISGSIGEKQLTLKVKDDGRGIPQADHQKIFKTYFTTGSSLESAIKSHGLGLAGVMVLLKDMGGELILNSEDGKGAEFIVKIPL